MESSRDEQNKVPILGRHYYPVISIIVPGQHENFNLLISYIWIRIVPKGVNTEKEIPGALN